MIIAIIGAMVGLAVALTGIGGGALLVPLLVLVLRVPPIVAVGTAALFMAITKMGAALSYGRRGHVDLRLVLLMACGSVPGAVLGVTLLRQMLARWGEHLNDGLKIAIGALLILTPVFMILRSEVEKKKKVALRDSLPTWITPANGAIMLGFVGGALVGLTAIGSGSIIMLSLVLFYSRPLPTLVGTDICHSVIIAAVAGAAHFRLGTVDLHLLAGLLAASIPAAILGSEIAPALQTKWLRRIVLSFCIVAGFAML